MHNKKKNLITWLIYDFGNSFYVTAISGLFLAQWLILDNKIDDIWYGAGFALATILVLLSSPFFGSWSDKSGKRMPFLKLTTLLLIFFNGFMAVTAVSSLPMKNRVLVVLCLSIVVQYLYQMSLIFYNALLRQVSAEKDRGKISGLGEGFNSLGWLLSSIILLPFANGAITLIGQPGRSQVFIPAFLISTLLMLPMIFLFKEKSRASETNTIQCTEQRVFKITKKGVEDLFKKNRNVGVFLIAFSLMSDVILTLNLYFAVVMDALYKVNDNAKTYFFAINLIFTIVLGYVLGRLADKHGHKKMLLLSSISLIAVTTIFYLSSSLTALYVVAVFGGAGMGGYYVVSRSLMIKISPQKRLGEYFGFYSTFSRVASIVAPLLWGVITLILKNYVTLKYQAAGMAMVLLLIIGTLILLKVHEGKNKAKIETSVL